jgi:DNA-directed RNA polymerase specialized sigma24 family protein
MKKPQAKQNESALVCAARRGDKDALARLLQDNWPWLKGLVYNVLGNTDDVDEALQDVCVLALKKISTLREPERFRGWLAVVARNAALGLRQKRSRRPIQLEELLIAEQMDGEENEQVVNRLIRQEQHQQVYLSPMPVILQQWALLQILELPIL